MFRFLIYSALLFAGFLGITLSVSLEAPTLIALGLAGAFAGGGGILGMRKAENFSPEGTAPLSASHYMEKITFFLAILSTVYFVSRALLSPVFDLGLEDLMLILPAGLFFLMAAYGVRGKLAVKLRQGMAWVVILLLLVHLGVCVQQLRGGLGFSLARYFEAATRTDEGGQLTGMYGYYGSLANFLVVAGLLCLSLGVWGRMNILWRGVLTVLALSAFGAAIYSGSRSAVMSLVIALVVFVIVLLISLSKQNSKIKKWGYLGIGGVSLLVLAGGLIGFFWVFKERGGDVESGNALFASDARQSYWSMAVEQWVDAPVFGMGSRSFSYECFKYWNPNMPTGEANPEFVHNEYLQLLADYGIVGLMLVLSLLGSLFYLGGKQIRLLTQKLGGDGLKKGSNSMALSIAGICGMAAMAMHVTTDFRTHLLANLLLLVCCAVWVLPVAKKRHGRVGSLSRIKLLVGGLMLMLFGLGTAGLGVYQLWGGAPLLAHQMAKEDDTWKPREVDRSVWIPSLEESVSRVPQFIRYLRLGTLYRIEISEAKGRQKELALKKAKKAYKQAIERNPFNPIPKINLAQVYAEQGEFEKADTMYAEASEMAKARERWFRMHSEWAKLHQYWAGLLWKTGELEKAETHLKRAKKLFKQSYDYAYFYQNRQWTAEYTRVLIFYARFLDAQKRFDEAEALFEEGKEQVNWYNMQKDTALGYYYAQHLYENGYAVWMKRKPKEAYKLMVKAKNFLNQYRGVMKGKVGLSWQNEMDKIQKVIRFLDEAGEGGK